MIELACLIDEEDLYSLLLESFNKLPSDLLAQVRDAEGTDLLIEVEVSNEAFYKHARWGQWTEAIKIGGPTYVLSALLWQLREEGVLGFRTNKVVIRFDNHDDLDYGDLSEESYG